MTPARLTELKCPSCRATHWVIDSDYRGVDGVKEPYEERVYPCPQCGEVGAGHEVLRQSPPQFLLQPHPMYPMSNKDFGYWLEIVMEHFPDSDMLERLAATWYPSEFGGRRLGTRQVFRSARFKLSLRPGSRPTVLAQSRPDHVIVATDGDLCLEVVFDLGPPISVARKFVVAFQSPGRAEMQTRIPLDEVTQTIERKRDKMMRKWQRYQRAIDRNREDLMKAIERARTGRSKRLWPQWLSRRSKT